VLIATWNVNSIRARERLVLDWLARVGPDVLCMQETKVVDDDFPREELLRLGYGVASAGERSYNGVAIAARKPLRDVAVGLHDDAPDAPRRLIAAGVGDLTVLSAYVPNGKHVASPAFPEKLRWLERLRETLDRRHAGQNVVLCGDFNVAPEARDVFDPERLRGQLHFHPDEHRALGRVLDFGLVDAFRLHDPEAGRYSWWDYRGPALRRNLGLRIDLILVARALVERCVSARIDADARRAETPSDHAPVLVEIR
jgi:exodeoxyribonuclease-3